MQVAAIVVAAGRGTRAGGEVPKQYRMLLGRPVLQHTLDALAADPRIGRLVVVIHPADRPLFDRLVRCPGGAAMTVVPGADSRGGSVRAGLAALPRDAGRVLIHDGARPLVTRAVIERVIDALDTAAAAAPALPVTDALWQGAAGRVTGTRDRAGLFRAQTPQGFHTAAIVAAHDAHDGEAADDVAVARAAGLDVTIVEGDEDNIKITHADDFARAARRLAERGGSRMEMRLGNGFDVHAFTEGNAVVLCGLRIPHVRALKGHSDADVAMHAVTDAIYGALADGDIGRHFPPSDPQWRGAASDIFLRHAVARAAAAGFAIANADCTIICEAPKIGPHVEAMRTRLAGIMGVAPARVGVKATTSERLGFTGREEGIAALATVTLVQP